MIADLPEVGPPPIIILRYILAICHTILTQEYTFKSDSRWYHTKKNYRNLLLCYNAVQWPSNSPTIISKYLFYVQRTCASPNPFNLTTITAFYFHGVKSLACIWLYSVGLGPAISACVIHRIDRVAQERRLTATIIQLSNSHCSNRHLLDDNGVTNIHVS